VIDFALAVFVFGNACVYAVLMGQFFKNSLNEMMDGNFEAEPHWTYKTKTDGLDWVCNMWAALIVLFLALPLSMIKDLNKIAFTSFIGITAVCFAVFAIMGKHIQKSINGNPAGCVGTGDDREDRMQCSNDDFGYHENKSECVNANFGCVWEEEVKPGFYVHPKCDAEFQFLGLLNCLSTLSLAYGYHHVAPNLYGAMKDRSPKRWSYSVMIGVGVGVLLTFICGLTGFWQFGDKTKDNVLSSYLDIKGQHFNVVIAARFCMLISLITAHPFLILALRKSLMSILETTCLGWFTEDPKGYAAKIENNDASWRIVNVILILLTLPPAFVLPMGTLCTFTGALAGSWVVIGIPGLMLWKQAQKRKARNEEPRKWESIVGISLTVLAVLCCLGGLVAAIYNAAE